MQQAITYDSTHLTQNPPLPSDLALAQKHNKHHAILKSIIFSSLPDTISSLHTPHIYTDTPYNIFQIIFTHIIWNTESTYLFFESTARTITSTPEKTLTKYMEEHQKLCTSMINANYPGFTSETTTIRFLAKGLRANPQYHMTEEYISLNLPPTVEEFANQIKQTEQYRRQKPNIPIAPLLAT